MHLKGMENIVGRILADAETSAAEIKAQSDAAVAEVMAAANTQAEQVYAQGLKSAKAEVENVLLRGKSMADLEGRKALLTARQSVIDEAFAAAVEQLQKKRKNKDGYAKLLADLAKPHLKDDSAVVVDKADFELIGAALKRALGCDVSSADLPSGGLVVKSGGIELNLTFTALLRQYREQLEQAVASVLFQ